MGRLTQPFHPNATSTAHLLVYLWTPKTSLWSRRGRTSVFDRLCISEHKQHAVHRMTSCIPSHVWTLMASQKNAHLDSKLSKKKKKLSYRLPTHSNTEAGMLVNAIDSGDSCQSKRGRRWRLWWWRNDGSTRLIVLPHYPDWRTPVSFRQTEPSSPSQQLHLNWNQ